MSEPAHFTCPDCGRTSHNPNDARERYCGACHTHFPQGAVVTTTARLQVAQKAWITAGAQRLLMVQYGHMGNSDWDLPGGRVDHGETDLDAALTREIKEETGLTASVGRTLAACLDTHPGNGAPTLYLIRQVSVLPGEPTHAGQTPEDDIVTVAWTPWSAIRVLTIGPTAFGMHVRRLATTMEQLRQAP